MFCLAAITPHTPLLIPNIGKENIQLLKHTKEAMEKIAEEIYLAKIDTVIVISSHAIQHEGFFSVNLHNEYQIEFKEFGDQQTSRKILPDTEFISQIQMSAKKENVPFTLDSDLYLDVGTSVPMFFCLQHNPDLRIVPLTCGKVENRNLVGFGTFLKEIIDKSSKRIAVFASGDLSHCLSSKAPLGFRPEGSKYDERLIEAVKGVSVSTLLNTDPREVEQAGQCINKQALILFGLLERTQMHPDILSYESPFGVGYLVSLFLPPAI